MFYKIKNIILRDGFFTFLRSIPRHVLSLRKRNRYRAMLKQNDIEAKFSNIFEYNLWGSTESKSGTGSELNYTENLRKWLIDFCVRAEIKTIVDAPCGDFNWMRQVLPILQVRYQGFDIVEAIVQHNSKHFGTESITFSQANICEDKLPACDLLIVRDCLFHLSYKDIQLFLKNIGTCDYKFLLTTTHKISDDLGNRDIVTGDFREIDLFQAPFYFSKDKVIEEVNETPGKNEIPRKMILIAKHDVPETIHDPALF